MLAAITAGVQIGVEPRYEANLSSPVAGQFLFSYRISIHNGNAFPVQLMRRHWYIFDSMAVNREVEGPGVVGEHPIIMPGGTFVYCSACDLRSMRGTMRGFYSMQNMADGSSFRVNVPLFNMEVPYALN
ncbi:MAG: Co2+/Mg2+ efflux protein ApaG [Flavobacteriales bacterium]